MLRGETMAVGLGGAVLGGLAGRMAGSTALGASIGAANGIIAGHRRIYDWTTLRGRGAFVLDSTWSLASTGAGLILLGSSKVKEQITGRSSGYDHSLSFRRNRMVHRGGVVLRRGFAVTIGNVINGAANRQGELTESRRRLVDEHEEVHVWQERAWGPLYPVLYLGWFIVGAAVALFRRSRNDSVSLGDEIDYLAYYRNPFEWHAYSRGGEWPPSWIDADRVWRRPFRSTSRNQEAQR
ncbi:MAG: hypothetical protein RL391_5 [Actinomycetota bacterium]|jgi:hypothetical protein